MISIYVFSVPMKDKFLWNNKTMKKGDNLQGTEYVRGEIKTENNRCYIIIYL